MPATASPTGRSALPLHTWGASPFPPHLLGLEGPLSFSIYWILSSLQGSNKMLPSLGRNLIPDIPSQNITQHPRRLFLIPPNYENTYFIPLSILVNCFHACLPEKTGSIWARATCYLLLCMWLFTAVKSSLVRICDKFILGLPITVFKISQMQWRLFTFEDPGRIPNSNHLNNRPLK